jgi:hypothetical protein
MGELKGKVSWHASASDQREWDALFELLNQNAANKAAIIK